MSDPEVKESEVQDQPEQEAEAKAPENAAAEEKPAAQEQPPKDMRAVVLTNFGGLKAVKIQRKPQPTVKDGEVLIRVKACGLNFQDLMVRQGTVDSVPKTPFILGLECAGEVEEIGEGVQELKAGDRVVALPEFRAWAEVVAVPAKYVFKIPDEMSYADAVAITLNYVVAYILVFEMGNIKPGRKLLLHSAGGGVGQAVVQLCRTIDDVTIFGLASKAKHENLKNIDHLLERGSDYVSEIKKVSPEGVDVVLDGVYGDESNKGYGLLKPLGKYVLFGSSSIVTGETKSFFGVAKAWWQVDKIATLKLFEDNKGVGGFNFRHLLYQQNGAPYVKSVVDKVFDLWKQNKIKPVIDSTWAWEDIPEAMQKLHDRKNVGKIVLDPAQEPKQKPATPLKGKKANSIEKEDKKKEDKVNGVAEEKPQESKAAPAEEKKENSDS